MPTQGEHGRLGLLLASPDSSPALQGSRGAEAGVGHGLWSTTWHHGHAGKGSCLCGVSHTAPLEACAPREVRRPSLPPPWSFQSRRMSGDPFMGSGREPLSLHSGAGRGLWGQDGRKWVLVFSDFARPAFSRLFLSLQMQWGGPGRAQSRSPPAPGTQTRLCPCAVAWAGPRRPEGLGTAVCHLLTSSA